MARLLSVVWYKVLPPQFGGQKGIALLNNHLAQHHPLVCLCSSNNEPADDLFYEVLPTLPTTKFQFINPLCWWHIYETARKHKISHIILEHPYHAIAGWWCKKLLKVKLVVHSHNIEYDRFKKLGKPWWRLLFYFEKWAHQQADLNLFKTQADLSHAVAQFFLDKRKCLVVHYGVDSKSAMADVHAREKVIATHRLMKNTRIALFAGTLDYSPNAEAVQNIYKRIAPALPAGYHIIICGRNKVREFQYLKLLQHEQVSYVGEVDDLRNYYAAADVFINPVTTTNGIQTKTIDALQHNLNVVCFENSLQGIAIDQLKEKLFVAPDGDWGRFLAQVQRATQFTSPTPPAFFEQYSWTAITTRVVEQLATM